MIDPPRAAHSAKVNVLIILVYYLGWVELSWVELYWVVLSCVEVKSQIASKWHMQHETVNAQLGAQKSNVLANKDIQKHAPTSRERRVSCRGPFFVMQIRLIDRLVRE